MPSSTHQPPGSRPHSHTNPAHFSHRPVGVSTFVAEVRPRLIRPREDDNGSVEEVAADIANRWQQLSEEEKQVHDTDASLLDNRQVTTDRSQVELSRVTHHRL